MRHLLTMKDINMIHFTDDDNTICSKLRSNLEYIEFVKSNCPKGYILISVGIGSVVLFHNIDDTFSTFLIPEELYHYRDNINDMVRIANTIQNHANIEFGKSKI